MNPVSARPSQCVMIFNLNTNVFEEQRPDCWPGPTTLPIKLIENKDKAKSTTTIILRRSILLLLLFFLSFQHLQSNFRIRQQEDSGKLEVYFTIYHVETRK
jgi:hypothetical protein